MDPGPPPHERHSDLPAAGADPAHPDATARPSAVGPTSPGRSATIGGPVAAAPSGSGRPVGARRRPVHLFCDAFPVLSETFVAAEARELARLGHPVVVVAGAHAQVPGPPVDGLAVLHLSDVSRRARLRALARLVARHPVACLRDRLQRRRWSREEPARRLRELAPAVLALDAERDAVAHAHFAAGAALDALRAAAIAQRPYTLTAHAYDIYLRPRNLREKLRRAALVTSGSAYTVADLRRIAGPEAAARVHEIVMGVDLERFKRATPHAAAATALAVGRLVEKKGFIHLVRAAAEPALRERLDELTIVGDGPERRRLATEVERLGLQDVVRLAGPRTPDEVRELLERAAVLAMPCVVAADGDRDSLPVVVKEALAMEVPVVASAEVGLPELVRAPFGRLVPPGDPPALARALADVLALPAERRAAIGRAGRQRVAERADLRAETARLSAHLQDLR